MKKIELIQIGKRVQTQMYNDNSPKARAIRFHTACLEFTQCPVKALLHGIYLKRALSG